MAIVNGYEIGPGADLTDADLSDANLTDANLTGAKLTAHAENTRLLKEAKLTLEERVDLYTLVGHIDDEDTPHDGITLNMYLTGEVDWRESFKKIFKREAGIRKPK